MNSAHSFSEGMDVPVEDLYLVIVMRRIPVKFWFITTYIYREIQLLVKARSVGEAHSKVKEVKHYYTHAILKTL